MAIFDAVQQRIFVRVVYDGVAGAGKTTNVRQLGSLFAAQRTREVRTPAELRGRTLFFDWLQISAGVVGGYPLLCQVLSVPGQAAFSARREHLLSTADVVVVVCDSSLHEIDRLRRTLAWREGRPEGAGPMAVIVQANKQDQLDAVDGKTLLQTLGQPDLEVVEAIASEGIGVVDTFVTAVRSVARTLNRRAEEGQLSIPVGRAEDEHQLLAKLTSVSIDRYGAAELLLEEASVELLLAGGSPRPTPTLAVVEEAPVESVPAISVEQPVAVAKAPLPQADVPTGFVWPAHTGRAMLQALAVSDAVAVGAEGVRHVVHDHVLTTSTLDRYADADAARHALVRAARERTQLDTLLVTDTVLVVQPDANGASWLWNVAPRIEPVADWVVDEPRARTDALGAAIADAVAVTLRHRLAFRASTSDFGAQSGRLRYGGPLAMTSSPAGVALDLVFGALDDVVALGLDTEVFVDAMTRRMRARLAPDETAAVVAEAGERASPHDAVHAKLVAAIRGFEDAA